MTDQLMIPLSKKADLVITNDRQLAIRSGVASTKTEMIIIGPLSDDLIENMMYAIQHMRIHV